MFELERIFKQFEVTEDFIKASELGTGHINDTFLIETDEKHYVLQRINHLVFKDTASVVENKVKVSNYLMGKFPNLPKNDLRKRVLIFIKAKSQDYFHKDSDGNFWNLTNYIENSVTYDDAPNENIAFEAGRIFGEFLFLLKDFESSTLTEILPNFHKMSFRFEQFDEALASASDKRKEQAQKWINFANESRNGIQKLEKLIAENEIPIQVTHNDTKISNILFSKDEKALCVIDTDTVMPGVIHFDFGDAIRIICNSAAEDEKDLSKISFKMDLFEAFAKGFLKPFKKFLSPTELENLAFSAKVMTFIVGLRMLTDFLNNDIYFKTKYEVHNLDRAKSQLKLVMEIEKNLPEMENIVRKIYKNL